MDNAGDIGGAVTDVGPIGCVGRGVGGGVDDAVDDIGAVGAFPPAGWVTNRQAAARLGVSLGTLTCNGWRWRRTLRASARTVRTPTGGRCNLYPAGLIERLAGERETAAKGPVIPEGMVDIPGACRFFGISRSVWKNWMRQGKINGGQRVPAAVGGKRTLYSLAHLQRLRDELFNADKVFKKADQTYHVPDEFVRREEAWTRFGVGKVTWERWEREGTIDCGMRVPAGPKLYKVADIERLIATHGRLADPYPDPERPGVVRVPLSGRDITRREAIIDAADLSLIEGGSCGWSSSSNFAGFVTFHSDGMNSVPLRRVILGLTAEDRTNVRHANGDPLDCRRENLVLRTVTQRSRNTKKVRSIMGRAPTSIFKGVYWETQTRRWRAGIRIDGKTKRLGRFSDQMQAAQAYDDVARDAFGEHARLNFPNGIEAWLETEYRKAA